MRRETLPRASIEYLPVRVEADPDDLGNDDLTDFPVEFAVARTDVPSDQIDESDWESGSWRDPIESHIAVARLLVGPGFARLRRSQAAVWVRVDTTGAGGDVVPVLGPFVIDTV
ncbi:hypothetical protein ER308_07175 [Egibacter rhizosphaerae]|uniref:Uncharacterized protein n=1 Tax=Egibacter rhizosphaerae TaxID=1670831 RepID=A0A411YDY7_9ACTN|nr:hypothetical protein [Egibacter rhizosphaerae]QBI19347.1 hypothetical protein ER308_07175 [Egibacter rhizosphaerae]